MNKALKTLLLATTIALPLSACSHFGHKNTPVATPQQKVVKHLEKAKADIAVVTADLQAAANEAKDPIAQKRLTHLVKESTKLSNKIANCKTTCDGVKEGKKHKRVHHTAKPLAPVAGATAPSVPADAKK